MRILLLNPNTTTAMTDRLAAVASEVVQPGTELVAVTASRGVPYIATRSEAQIGGAVALEILAQYQGEVDAAVIAAFGDPGLMAARELFDMPIVGMAEAAMLTACMLGGRFSIVTFAQALGPWFRECVEMHKLSERCAGVRMLTGPVEDVVAVQRHKEDLLVELCLKAVEEDEADVIILGGAPLAGLAGRIRDRVPVPVVDQIAAAVKQAETLLALKVNAPTAGSFRRPDGKGNTGLPDALAGWMSGAAPQPKGG